MSRTPRTLMLGVALLALLATGCRGTSAGGGSPNGDSTQSPDGDHVVTDIGVTDEPCPNAVNADNGCIYLGIISDLTEGPFAALAVPITEAQKAFWQRVNEQGGIGGYDIDATTYVRDNKYNPEIHNQVYQEIKSRVLALAQTLGSPTTAAIIDDMRAENIIGTPASWTSLWDFEDVILESGSNYCFEAMNLVDYAIDELGAQSIMAVHYPGDAGDDGAAGARTASEGRGVSFTGVPTTPGPENQGSAVDQIVSSGPDAVLIVAGPTDTAAIVGESVARGYEGTFLGSSPTWNPALLAGSAADAFRTSYLLSGFWAPFGGESAGHEAMRLALGDVTPNDGYIQGWTWSYPLKAALERAVENRDLTRLGLLEAAKSLEDVDYEGILPPGAGQFSGEPSETIFKQTLILQVDDDAPTGVTVIKDFFAGPSAQNTDIDRPCYQS